MMGKCRPIHRVLLVSGTDLFRSGVPLFILQWIRNAPEYSCDFTYYCPGMEDKEFAQEFQRLGVKLVTGKHQGKRLAVYAHLAVDLFRLMRDNNFDIVHINSGAIPLEALVLSLARLRRIPLRIAHSHSAGLRVKALGLINPLLQKIVLRNATQKLACSETAARHLFGQANDVKLVRNGIDIRKFAFSSEIRNQCREQLQLADEFVIGHVGTFDRNKNQCFLLKVFQAVLAKEKNARLLLVGDGELAPEVRRQADRLGLGDKVIMPGFTDHVRDYMCAMDVFVLPSLYEGMPYVGIEAQTVGLRCFFSDTVTREIDLTGKECFLSLAELPELWADRILAARSLCGEDRSMAQQIIASEGYDISTMGDVLEKSYQIR